MFLRNLRHTLLIASVYISLFFVTQCDRTGKMKLWLRCLESIIVICGTILVSMSRIYLRYHTPRQVLCGGAIGVVLGISWHLVVVILRYFGVVDWILELWFVQIFWFKDGDIGSLEHDLYEEWMIWKKEHDERKSSNRKDK